MAAVRRRRFAVAFAATTLATVTVGLLARLALDHHHVAVASPPTSVASVVSPAPAPPLSPAWKVAFEDKSGGVSVMKADGSNLRHLLDHATQPTWSLDRRRLAFARRGNLWVADADGKQQTQLTFWPDATDDTDTIHGICWDAQDGLISFGRDEVFVLTRTNAASARAPHNTVSARRDEGTFRTTTLYHARIPAPGAAVARVTDPFFPFTAPAEQTPTEWANAEAKHPTPPRFDWTERRSQFEFSRTLAPAWSADGKRLFFARNGDLWLADYADFDGGKYPGDWDVERVAAAARYDGATAGGSRWTAAVDAVTCSPDGATVVYNVIRYGGSGIAELHVLRYGALPDKDGDGESDGEGVLSDTTLPVYGWHPSLSPDGKWVLCSGRDGKNGLGLLAVTLDGQHVLRLPAPDDADNPAW